MFVHYINIPQSILRETSHQLFVNLTWDHSKFKSSNNLFTKSRLFLFNFLQMFFLNDFNDDHDDAQSLTL